MKHQLLIVIFISLSVPTYATQQTRQEILQCEKNLAVASRYKKLVTEPVQGLYQSIPINNKFKYENLIFVTEKEEIKITETGSDFAMSTEIFNKKNEKVGAVKRWFSKNSTEMIFDIADFTDQEEEQRKVPKFINIPEAIPLVAGRGIPAQAFITLMQMKMAGVPYGGLKHAETNAVMNYMTSLELVQDPVIQRWMNQNPRQDIPGKLIADALLSTLTGRYISTVLTQSGHHIDKIAVTEVKMVGVFDYTPDEMDKSKYIRLLRKGFTQFNEMPSEFRVSISLSPIP